MKRTTIAFLIALFAMGHAQKTFAHATPTGYEPAASSVLTHTPSRVQIRFSERIDPGASSITVFAPDGSTVDAAKSTVDPEDAHLFSTAMHAAGSGTYAVSWQVVSADDGHFTKGGFLFSLGTETQANGLASGQFQISHRSSWPEAITIWLELLGAAMLLGALALTSILRRKLSPHTHSFLIHRLRLLLILSLLLMIIGSLSYLWLESTNLAFDQSTTFTPALRSFLATVAGRFTVYRLILGLMTSIFFAVSLRSILRSSKRLTLPEAILWILLIAVALLRARVSHAAASAFHPIFSIAINAIHLLFKDLWIGGLIAFVIAFLPALEREKNPRLTILSLLCFSNLLLLSLAVGGVSGVYIVWLHLKSPANLLTTHWGGYFLALSAYALVLLMLRMYQQRMILPAIIRSAEGKADQMQQEIARSTGMILLAEMFVGVAVLLFSSILIITTPPLSPQTFYERTQDTANASITLGEHHFETDQFLITVQRKDRQSTGSGRVLTVTLTNPDRTIGPIVVQTEERFLGGYVFPKENLSPPGMWTIDITEQEPHAYDAVGSFTLQYPDDLDAVHRDDTLRRFGLFELFLTLIACIIVGLAWRLACDNRRWLRSLAGSGSGTPLSVGIPHLGLAIVIDLLLVFFIGLSLGGHNHGSTSFQEACRLRGGLWHENVPMRDGKPTSSAAVLGCMLGSGQGTFHFADPREFNYFTRRTQAHATLKKDPITIQPGKPVTLLFTLRDANNQPITGLTLEHDRILHAVIVSQDVQSFAHVHAEDNQPVTPQMIKNAMFPVRYTFPKAGKYLIGLDFTVRSQTFSQTFTVDVGNTSVTLPLILDAKSEKKIDGITAHLRVPTTGLKAGVIQKLTYTFEHEGAPVTDLQPYLSAAMHLSIVNTDLRKFIHTHAELPQSFLDSLFNPRDPKITHVHQFLPDRFGPDLVAYVLFPLPGDYEIFGEVKRGGKTVTIPFRVRVE